MMNRAAAWAIVAAAMVVSAAPATAQLTEYVWDTTKTGSQQWQNPANWAPAGFPNGPLQSGNLSRPLGANLNVDVAGNVTTAGVVMGATAAARTTEISNSTVGGLLTFRNEMLAPSADFNGSTIVEGFDFLIWQRNYGRNDLESTTAQANGDADASLTVTDADYALWKAQFTAGVPTIVTSAFVHSVGTAGSVNRILANIHLNNEQLEIGGTNDLTINGALTYNGDTATAFAASASALRVMNIGQTLTMNGGIVVPNVDDDPAVEGDGGNIDLALNTHVRAKGKMVLNGVISGAGDISLGFAEAGEQALSTIELNGANTFTGDMFFNRGNFILASDNAIGINPGPLPDPSDDVLAEYRPNIGANLYGSNFISTSDARNIRNDLTLGGTMTIKGQNSLTLSGTLTQTNNRQLVNVLPAGKTLTLSGRIDIWEDDENIERRWEIDGTGKTLITGSLRDFPDGSAEFEGDITAGNRQLIKRGTGVLVVDTAAGGNAHLGPDVIYMGNLHYADNDSLNTMGLVRAVGGAVGVDTGVSSNATFASLLDPTSRGGLMLAPSDAAAPLNFASTLSNAANMTVAAPDGTTPASPYSYTGAITPATNKYQLGGGTGTLRLPNAQLTGANNLEVRNGGTVQLFGANTYTGSTTLLTKYTSTKELQAAGDHAGAHSGVYYSEVAPTLEVNKLSNGGVASSIGSASNAASNLFIQGSTLRYVGTGDSTDRLFTIGTGGATIESSGSGAVNFNNAGALGRDDVEDKLGDLDDFTGTNDSNQLYNVNDSSDIIVGMTVTDPDIGGIGAPGPPDNPVNPPGPNPPLIPGPSSILNPSPTQTTVTGISDGGGTLGLSASYGFRQKLQTRLVFGTVPRTLTLGGSNAGANTLAPVISNSAAGGVVNVAKTGTGTWILSGANTYTGTTTVSAGTLIVNGTQTGGGATTVASGGTVGGGGQLPGNLTVSSGGTVDPGAVGALAGVLAVNGSTTLGGTTLIEIGGTGPTQFDQLNMTGTLTAGGVFDVDFLPGYGPASGHSFDVFDFTTASGAFTFILPALGGGLSWNTSSLLTTGTLSIGGPVTAVPEPATVTLIGLGLVGCWRRRRGARGRG